MTSELRLDLDDGTSLMATAGGPDHGGVVVFAHGSGSSRHSVRNRQVAETLHQSGIRTLLLDLMTLEEERVDIATREFRFDIQLLGGRVIGSIDWIRRHDHAPIGLFGASTGAAAALVAAAARPEPVAAVVSRGGRPDLAGDSLPLVRAPTLLIVGGQDQMVLELNREAQARLTCTNQLEVVTGATHLFEEPGTLEEVSRLAAGWFVSYLV